MMRLTFSRAVFVGLMLLLIAGALPAPLTSAAWGHLHSGQGLMALGALPTADTLLQHGWSAAATWLGDVAWYGAWAQWGRVGVSIITAVCALLIASILYAASAGPAWLRALGVLWAALVLSAQWAIGPIPFTLILFSACAALLTAYGRNGVNHLWYYPLLIALWANLNADFFLGLGLLAVTLVGQMLAWWGRRVKHTVFGEAEADTANGHLDARGLLMLTGVGVVSLAATLLNPLGLAGWGGVWAMGQAFLDPHMEVIGWGALPFATVSGQAFIGLLLVTVATLALTRRRANFAEVLLVCVAGYWGFAAEANMAALAIIAPALLTRHLAVLWEDSLSRIEAVDITAPPPVLSRRAAGLAVGLWLALGAFAAWRALQPSPLMPTAAADFILSAHLEGRMFNSARWGGYLSWALPPTYPVFVDDSRPNYATEIWQDYQYILAADVDYEARLEVYGLRLVLIEPAAPLNAALNQNPAWRRAYTDSSGNLYVHITSP